MILGNYTQENRNCYRVLGQAFSNPLVVLRPQVARNFHITAEPRTGIDQAAFPTGYNTQECWQLPLKAGGIGATESIIGTGTLSASALAVKLALADLTGSGDISDALGSLIVSALANLTGSGGITDANLQAFLQAVASITGSGGVSDASLTGLAELIAAIGGSGDVTATLTAIGELAAALTVTGTGLSTANVAEAVWGALATANNAAGTMGEKLNDAGSASNPWTEVIESGYTAAEILRLIAAAVQGNATGLESGAPTFKGLDGTTDRITATYVDGDRVITDRDAT